MEFTYVNPGPAVFFSLAGSLTVNANLHGLRAAIREISDQEVSGVFLDLGRVTQLDCWGIGELIRLRRLVTASGRRFGLVHVGRRERRLLELARLADVLGLYDSTSEALRSVTPAAPPKSEISESPFSVRPGSRRPRSPMSFESITVRS